MLQVPDCPSNVILSAREMEQFNQRVEDGNLCKIWPVFQAGFTAADPDLEGVPASGAAAKDIRHWMHANQPLMQGIPALSLRGLNLACVPKEIRLCTGLQCLSICSNELTVLPGNLFQGLSGLKMLGLSLNRTCALREGIFDGLSVLQMLHLGSNDLADLPEGIFRGLTELRELNLVNNGLLFFPERLLQDLPQLKKLDLKYNTDLMHGTNARINDGDIYNHLSMVWAFFGYACESPLAQFYQSVARNPGRQVVQRALSQLPFYLQLEILKSAWVEEGRPDHHPLDDMAGFCRALKKYATQRFCTLNEEQRTQFHGHLYALALHEPGPEPLVLATLRAEDNILRLIDALVRLQQGGHG
jgi:hypothetical protein